MPSVLLFFFFFNDTATTEIYTLSLHDALPISSAAVEPSKGAFDDPTAWKHHESFRPIGALDDFSFELWQDLRQGLLKVRPLVDRKSTRLNSSHANISYAVFCLKKKRGNDGGSL